MLYLIDPTMVLQSTGGLINAFQQIQEVISSLGPALMMPIVIFLLAVIFKVETPRALNLGLLVGVGFVGIFAVMDYTLGPIGSTVEALTEVWSLNVIGIDVGWAAVAGFTWGLGITVLIIPVALIVNLVMIMFGWTRTFNADVWNFWHFILNGAFVYVWTDSWILGFGAAIVTEVIVLKLADWTTDLGQDYFGIPGANLPHTETVSLAPFAFAVDKVLVKVPGIGDRNYDPQSLEDRIGIFGEPIVMGFLLGIFLGLIARQPWMEVFRTGIMVAALITLLPRMVGLLIEGLEPVADQASTYFQESDLIAGEDFNVGIDAGPIALSDTTSVTAGLLLAPYVIALAFLPGVRVMPLADLAMLPLFTMWAAAISDGDLLRTLINGLVMTTIVVFSMSALAGPVTEIAELSGGLGGVETGGAELVSAVDIGGHFLTVGASLPFAVMGDVSVLTAVGGVGIVLFGFALYWWTRDMPDGVAHEQSDGQMAADMGADAASGVDD